ncbi:putative transposase for insertion sequence element IS6501 [Parachlamydia acanthamoebae]|uniref:Putative transposase for insertion sequence element IS6501 n=1 Tax=Parachlamydia acanthamoebae TaxID=83552 RepID=A0A0C1CAU5_9BACT|nr:putative transposase for insertion sequence element IS6501 [Parachlamydia acanthamoebae]
MQAEIVIADKAFDVILPLRKACKGIVIPSKNNAKESRDYDKHLYKSRHLIENFFAKLKQYRGIVTRYDKTVRNFLFAIYLAASVIWLN